MSKPNARHLFQDRDRHGNVRYYFRRRLPGSRRVIKVRIHSPPGTNAFAREFLAAMQLHGAGFFSMTKKEKKPGLIYFIGFDEWVKIGFTADELNKRIAQLQTSCPAKLVAYAAFPGIAGYERSLQRRFRADRAMGEWFRLSRPIRAFMQALPVGHTAMQALGNIGDDFFAAGGSQRKIKG